MFDVRNDLRWTLRYARRHPAVAIAVTTTLSVSIAAATTAFGLATAVLWRPLPFRDASRLVFVWEENDRDGQRDTTRVTGARHAAWRHASNGLEAIALFGAVGFTIESADGAMSIRGVRVSANYFETLGIGPLVGRAFAADDEKPGGDRVVILSHALWRGGVGGGGRAGGAGAIRRAQRRRRRDAEAERPTLHDRRRHAAGGVSRLAGQSGNRHARSRRATVLGADRAHARAGGQRARARLRRGGAPRARRQRTRGN